jgi:hypothetical protein
MKKYVYLIVLTAGIFFTRLGIAGDGDVDYSAPYITVDPETGQLVTRNPGPKMKMHEPMPPSNSDKASSAMISPAREESAVPVESGASAVNLPVVVTLAALGIGVVALALWKLKRNQAASS